MLAIYVINQGLCLSVTKQSLKWDYKPYISKPLKNLVSLNVGSELLVIMQYSIGMSQKLVVQSLNIVV